MLFGRQRVICTIRSAHRALTFMETAATPARSKPKVVVKPVASLIDEKVDIAVIGATPKQRLTLKAKLTGDRGERFESFAHYIADEHGTVSVSSQPSVGGSYTEIEPMGLLWSMEPSPGQKRGIRLQKRDVTKPYIVNLDVFDGHLRFGGDQDGFDEPLSSVTFEKYYMKAGVRRIPVREGRVRGTLFLPPGDGPFPGVMEFLGTAGGLLEFKSALLASHGFAALCLAYFGFEDLPKALDQVELEYFEEAAKILLQNHYVSPGGIGLFSISKGSEIALMLAAHNSNIVKAVVAVSPSHAVTLSSSLHKGIPTGYVPLDANKVTRTEDGDFVFREAFKNSVPAAVIPVELIRCPVYLVYGSDDCMTDASYEIGKIQRRMEEYGKGSLCSVSGYPNAGHLIEPPCTPLCSFCYHKMFGFTMASGGESKAHAMAQEDSWNKSLEFLRKHLPVGVKSHL